MKPDPINIQLIQWEYEDSLPQMADDEFNLLFNASKVDVVRLYPFVVDSSEERIFIGSEAEPSSNPITPSEMTAHILELEDLDAEIYRSITAP